MLLVLASQVTIKMIPGQINCRIRRVFGIVASCAIVSGGLTLQGPGQAAFAWELGTPIVTYWGGWSVDSEVAQYVAAGGYNLAWATTAYSLDVIEERGMRGLWMDSAFNENFQAADLTDPAKRAYLDETVDLLKSKTMVNGQLVPRYPGFYGYYLYDEPLASKFPAIGQLVAYLRERDPDHLAYVNISGLPGNITSQQQVNDYHTYLNQYLSTVKPDLLSYDYYQLMNNFSGTTYVGPSDLNGYLMNLGIISTAAKQAGIPFMNVVQAARWNAGVRVPNSNELRFLVYSTLAYGAQGISYYNWYREYTAPVQGEPYYNGNTTTGGLEPLLWNPLTPTDVYTALTPLNREFLKLAQQLQGREWIGTYLRGYATNSTLGYLGPPGTATLPSNSPFNVSNLLNSMTYHDYDPLKGLLLGLFGSPGSAQSDATFVLVQNLDYSASVVCTLTGPANLSTFDATTGQWTAWGQSSITLNLLPGGGILVGLTSSLTLVPGDFDGDGDVDGADFVAWQTNFPKTEGGTLATGDADGDGDVDGADFVVWQTNFPTAAGALGTPVAEPSSTKLWAIAGVGLALMCCRVNRQLALTVRSLIALCQTTLLAQKSSSKIFLRVCR